MIEPVLRVRGLVPVSEIIVVVASVVDATSRRYTATLVGCAPAHMSSSDASACLARPLNPNLLRKLLRRYAFCDPPTDSVAEYTEVL